MRLKLLGRQVKGQYLIKAVQGLFNLVFNIKIYNILKYETDQIIRFIR